MNLKRYVSIILVLLSMSMLFVGCGKQEEAKKDSVKIVTSFFPIYVTAINVAGGIPGVEIENMTAAQTGCLHDYQLTTRDMKILEDSDIFIVNGAGMESFLDKIIEDKKDLVVIEASNGIELLEDEEGANPHVWVSVSNAILQVDNVVAALAKADPAHQEEYEKNGAAYKEKLIKLHNSMHERLDKYQGKSIITFHEAFPYFAEEFSLDLAGVIQREPGSDPTPEEIAESIELVKKLQIKAIFTEPQYSPKAANTIAEATGAKVYVLDPVVTGDATPEAANAYLERMEENAQVIEKAFQ